MITVFYNTNCHFDLTEEEFAFFKQKLAEGWKHVRINRINAEISGSYLWAGEKPQSMKKNEVMFLPDGLRVKYNNFGELVGSEDNIRVDCGYYRSRYGKDIDELLIPFEEWKDGRRIPQIENPKIRQVYSGERKALSAGDILKSKKYDDSKIEKTN
jgi:hypothetical protein